MIFDDFVMLGKTVPEANSDGREFVCAAGYSLELRQPIRIYPMARVKCPPRWSTLRIPVERNARDSRMESWKIRGDRRPGAHDEINSVISTVGKCCAPVTQKEIVAAMVVRSLKQANEEKRSLCVLLPDNVPKLDLESGDTAQMAPTRDLFGNCSMLPVVARFRWHPRLRFIDPDGDSHDLMLRDWGCYEYMRKHGDEAAIMLGEALNLSTAPPLLCGNLNRFRNSWLIISVFSGAIHARPEVSDNEATDLFERLTECP